MSTSDLKKSYSEAVESLFRKKTELKKFAQSKLSVKLASSFDKTLCWCVGLSGVFKETQARIHLSGIRSEVVNVLALVPFYFYRQSLICLRIILDEVLAFSYFESHPKEFKTLLRDPDFYVSKKNIYEFHKIHSWDNINSEQLSAWSRIESQYRELSRIIHAQTPEYISLTTSFQSFKYSEDKMDSVLQMAKKNDEAVSIFFASIYRDEFNEFRPEFKKAIIKSWDSQFIKDIGLRP
jgi:hypothetical protein